MRLFSKYSWQTLLSSLIVFGLLAALSLDSISSPTKIERLIGIPSYELVVPALLILAGLRLGWNTHLFPIFRQFLQWIIFPILMVTTGVLTGIDAVSPLNTVFSLTRLHQSRLGLVVVFLFFVLLIDQTNAWWKRYRKTVIAVFPLLALIAALAVRLWPWNMFLELVKEDRLTENLQFIALAVAATWGLTRAWHHFRQQKYLEAVFALLIGLGFLFIAGDEVSWMQRHLGFETPTALAEANRQEEVSIHNLYAVEWLVQYVYIGLSLVGMAGLSVSRILLPRQWKHWSELFPSHLFFWYFALAFAPLMYNFYKGGGHFRAWSEPVELALYIGLGFWAAGLMTLSLRQYFRPQT